MSTNNKYFTDEQLDFIKEMMNIGAGNAATALQQMLQQRVDLTIPNIRALPIIQVSSIFDNPSLQVVCVKMGMVGDVNGYLFFIVPEEHRKTLGNIVKQVTPGLSQLKDQPADNMDNSTLAEVGNIVSGTYLAAIHDFCELNIYHTVPVVAIDMIQALLDEILIELNCPIETAIALKAEIALIIENEFSLEAERFKTFLLVIPLNESIEVLAKSMEQAKKAYGGV